MTCFNKWLLLAVCFIEVNSQQNCSLPGIFSHVESSDFNFNPSTITPQIMSVRAHKLVLYIFPHPPQLRQCHGCVTTIEYCYQNGTMNTDIFYFYSLQRLNTDVIRGQNPTFTVIRRYTARATQSTCSTRYCCDNATISSSFKLFDAFGVQLNFSGGATLLSFTNMTVITFNKVFQRRLEENETISHSSLMCMMDHPFLLRFKIGTRYIAN